MAITQVTTPLIADNAITRVKLASQYTAINALGSSSGDVTLDFSLYNTFTLTLAGLTTLNITNAKVGDVKTILIEGDSSSSVYFPAGSQMFYVVSGALDNTSSTNFIQIECVDDSPALPVFYLSISQGTFAVGL